MKITAKDNVCYLSDGRLEIFTPQKYLGSSSHIDGDKVLALGLVPYKFYAKITDKKPIKVGIFNNPSITTFYPVDIEQNVTDGIWTGIYDYTNENEYMKLVFEGGGKLFDQFGVKHLDNVVLSTDLLLAGKLDNNIPYSYLATSWIKNMVMNNVSLSVPATVINMIIYELCRSVHNKDVRFASVIGKDPKTSPVAYRFANIREICASNSVFSALAFEDMNSMLDASLNMTLMEKEQKISPLEQLIKM